MAERMDELIRQVLRQELSLGLGPAYRIALDVEGGVSGGGDRYCWGVWNHERQMLVPELRPALTGFIEGIGVKTTEWKEQKKHKLVLHMDCGPAGQYSVTSGLETAFSRGLLNCLATLAPRQARSPARLVAKPGDDSSGKVVLCAMYAQGDRGLDWVKPAFEYPRDIGAIRALYRAATEVVPKLDLRSWEERQSERGEQAA
jgi:hypothetical protein